MNTDQEDITITLNTDTEAQLMTATELTEPDRI